MNTKLLHEKAIEAAARYRRSESELIEILEQLDAQKAYRDYECASLFQYAVKFLRLSEDTALNFITVARKAREIPALKQELERGAVTVSKVRKISSVMTRENQEHWLALAKALPQKKLEREVAKVNPKAAVSEKASYVSGDRLKLELGVSEPIMAMLRRAQDLESQRGQKAVSLEDTLRNVLECYLGKNDPVRKAEKVLAKTATRGGAKQGADRRAARAVVGARRTMTGQRGHRKPLPAETVHQLNHRDQGQCTARDSNGERCGSTRWLDFHHVRPIRVGGDDTVANLATLCRGHHRSLHAKHPP